MGRMDNDELLILKTLYENREVDVYQIHVETKIPPTTLYKLLESERKRGNVSRNKLKYALTPQGETFWAKELAPLALNPSTLFKEVPQKFVVSKVAPDDVSVLEKIVQ